MNFKRLTFAELTTVRRANAKHPRIAVDVGFSSRASTGIEWGDPGGPVRHAFGKACAKVVEILSGPLGGEEALLILEAPLSGMYASTGTPQKRGPFERTPVPASPDHPGFAWSSNAGATTAWGAYHMLRALAEALPDDDRTIHVVEAFAPTVLVQGKLPSLQGGAKAPHHLDDLMAEYIYDHWAAAPILFNEDWRGLSPHLQAATAILNYA